MQDVIENRNKLLDADEVRLDAVTDIQDHFPEFVIIYHLMLAYENVMSNDLPTAMECINKAELSLDDLKQKAILGNLGNVLDHVFVATKCHVLQKLAHRMTEVDELLKGICDVDDMNDAESAMLSGCQCLAWSLYYATDNLKSIECAKKAIDYEPTNGRWYFLLGKNYRRLRRRHVSIYVKPSPQESMAYAKAFDLNANALFGVSLAHKNCGGSSSRAGISYRQERSCVPMRGILQSRPQRSGGDGQNSPQKPFSSIHAKSDQQATRGSRSNHPLLRPFKDKKDVATKSRVEKGSIRQTASLKPRAKDDGSEADASCILVKTLKDLNI